MPVVMAISNQSAKYPFMLRLLKALVRSCLTYNVFFSAKPVPGNNNAVADALTRSKLAELRALCPQVDSVSIPSGVMETWCPVASDLIAASLAAKTKYSMPVVMAISNQSAKYPFMLRLLKALVRSCLTYNVFFSAKPVPGNNNAVADALTRSKLAELRALCPQVDNVSIPVFSVDIIYLQRDIMLRKNYLPLALITSCP
ncbi:hypothetical protein NDU88_005278 [Pleurodeles waltl]|uniref:Uncharacterized protein n=1 Tax=Pleurodeles waltl TaxID=8319 RepID=A0AAV7NRS5_PLEWA|nr:hypothetical protein NDU88_005278 [Pleurodeles waltl]